MKPARLENLGEGYYNRAYTIPWHGGGKIRSQVVRVSLPIEPRWKILSEHATMEWVERNTELPVPQVYEVHDELERTAEPVSDAGDSPKE